MTAHRMTARTRARIFAGQLFRITFIFEGEEFAETAAETLGIEASFDHAAMTNRNDARFFGDHDDDGVGLFAEARAPRGAAGPASGRDRRVASAGKMQAAETMRSL